MDGVRDLAPAGDLLGRVQAGRVLIALGLGRNLSGLGDDQAGRRALRVVGRGKLAGHQPGAGTVAGQRCHDDAIGERQVTEGVRLEKRFL